MNDINIEPAVEYMKTLVDKNRCVICDLLNGPIVRYPCGHSVCKTCVETAEDCLLCLSPPIVSTNFTDAPSSQRIEHVSRLLTAFQDLFNFDVYKRHRLSEQLKLEKQIFPKCIQAPTKYCNKRKSNGVQDKENSRVSFIAGENISNVSKMENTIHYVQQWLKNNESATKPNNNLPRKPFADLNVNDQSFTKDSLVTKVNNNRVSCRKRTHIKVFDTSKRLLPKRKKKDSLIELTFPKENKKTYLQKRKSENDESGIVIDEETIVIDNSQRECIDRDKLALIAVKEAEKLDNSDFIDCGKSEHKSTFKNYSTAIDFETIKSCLYKIPFYKKSLLYKICDECVNEKNVLHNADRSKNLKVVIDGNKLITTITFTQCLVKNVEIVNKKSVEIQTDTCIFGTNEIITPEHNAIVQKPDEKLLSLLHQDDIKSADLFIGDVEISKLVDKNNLKNAKDTNVSLKKDKCVIIEESDTDSDVSETENTLEVTAEVHRAETYDDFGVLSTLEPNEYATRSKQKRVRGHTPLSTDSSDKENYDPNRMKRQKFGKKHCNKK